MNRAPSLLVVSIALAGCHALLDLDRFAPAEGVGGAGGAGGSGGAGAAGGGGTDCTNGCLRSVQRFGGAADEEGRALLRTLVGGETRMTLIGHFQSSFSFGTTPLVHESGIDLFAARTSPDLSAVDWTNSYASPASENAQAIAYDGSSTYICGGFAGTLKLGNLTPLSAMATDAGFVVKLGSDGMPIWAFAIQSDQRARCNAVAVDDAGVYIAGAFEGELELGPSSVGSADGWVMKLDKGNSNPIWIETFGSSSAESVNTLAVRDHVLYLGARFNGNVDDFFGASDLTADTMANQNDSVVAAIDVSGSAAVLDWKQTLSGPGQQSIEQLVVDASARVHVVGSFNDQLLVAGGDPEFADEGDGFYVRLSSMGVPTLVVPLSGQSDSAAHAVAVDESSGDVAIGMSIGLDLSVNGVGRIRAAESAADAGVVRLDSEGRLSAIHWLGVAGHHEICWGVAFADDGDIVATGSLGPDAKVDGVAVDAGGDPNSLDLFIARFQRGM